MPDTSSQGTLYKIGQNRLYFLRKLGLAYVLPLCHSQCPVEAALGREMLEDWRGWWEELVCRWRHSHQTTLSGLLSVMGNHCHPPAHYILLLVDHTVSLSVGTKYNFNFLKSFTFVCVYSKDWIILFSVGKVHFVGYMK